MSAVTKCSRNLLGLFAIGTHPAIIVNAPLMRPELPMPATVRPTINMCDETATPQSNGPSSKRTKKIMKVHWISLIGYMLSEAMQQGEFTNLRTEIHK